VCITHWNSNDSLGVYTSDCIHECITHTLGITLYTEGVCIRYCVYIHSCILVGLVYFRLDPWVWLYTWVYNTHSLYMSVQHALWNTNRVTISYTLYIRVYTWVYDTHSETPIQSLLYTHHPFVTRHYTFHSRRRTELKYLDLQIFPVFLETLLSNGHSIYTHKPQFEISGTPEKSCLICTGTPVKTCWRFRQS